MPRFEFRLPDIGEGIAEAEIVTWHVKVGDVVTEDQGLADMMTDKATVEMESPVTGTVIEVAGEVGDMIPIGSTLVVIEVEGEAENPLRLRGGGAPDVVRGDGGGSQTPQSEEGGAPLHHASVVPSLLGGLPPASQQTALASGEEFSEPSLQHFIPEPHPDATEISVPIPSAQAQASPAVRLRAKELGIDLSQVKSQDGGRIRHADLDQFISYNAGQGYVTPVTARADEVVKVIGMRRRIAENMAASKRHIPHFTYVEEIDVTQLEAMRADINAHRGAKPKITMLPLMIVAICQILPRFPMINARYDDEVGVVTRHGAVHLGMATQTDAGLMVPVIRDAQAKNIWQLAAEITRLAEAARTGKAKSEELSGSTLTLTSLGALGGIATTPVINRPEVAIIGPNRIVERPVFFKNALGHEEIRKAKLMNLSISCDHRVVDGWDAASFVQAVKARLETPVLLFTAD
jgi:2-oxoisovalerate dehydrogenase E2 component (dihydrolipoyl transacylase)